MNKQQYDDLIIAIENNEGHIDYLRENFRRLNPTVPDTADNWYQWRVKTSQNRLRKLNAQLKLEPIDCSAFDKGIVE